MKKQKTLLIVVLIMAIVIVGLFLAVRMINGQKEQTGEEVKPVVKLTEMEEITYAQYKNAEDVVTLVKTDGVWTCEENPEIALIDVYVDEKVAELAKIEGTLVADAVKADCGLEETTYSLVVKNSEKEVRLVLGVDERGHCYAMLEGKNEIYEISEDIITILNLRLDNFRAVERSQFDEETTTDENLVEEIVPDTIPEDTTAGDELIEDIP